MNTLPHKHTRTSLPLLLKTLALAMLLFCTAGSAAMGQGKEISSKLTTFFQNYPLGFNTPPTSCALTDVQADDSARVLHIYVNEVLGMRAFTKAQVLQLYTQVKALLPALTRTAERLMFQWTDHRLHVIFSLLALYGLALILLLLLRLNMPQ